MATESNYHHSLYPPEGSQPSNPYNNHNHQMPYQGQSQTYQQMPQQQYAPIGNTRKKRYLPVRKVDYVHMLQGPEFKVWKPFASFGVVIGSVIVLLIGTFIVMMIAFQFTSDNDGIVDSYAVQDITASGLVAFVINNLFLASFIPLAMLATWVIHRTKPGFVSSVLGRFRWGWFGWCMLITIPIWAMNFAVTLGLNNLLGNTSEVNTIENPQIVIMFIVLVLLTTPLQATGEEYLLRGWMLQNIGAFIKDKYIAVLVGGLSSGIIFSLLHLNFNPIALIFYFNFSVAAIIMTVKTGGLEAASSLHIIHNVYVFHLMIFFQENIDRSPIAQIGGLAVILATDFVFLIILTTAIIFLAKSRKVAEEFTPNESEVIEYNQNQERFLQQTYFTQYQQYLQQLNYYNDYQNYYNNYYNYYYRRD